MPKSCEHPDCNTRPHYNLQGEKRGKFCSLHKAPGMVDVKSPKCEHPDCKTQPHYGLPGQKATRCGTHKADIQGCMKDPKKKCSTRSCNELALYADPTANSASCCETHKKPLQLNIIERKCSSCGLPDVLLKSLCSDCNPELRKRYIMAKQEDVKHYLERNAPDLIEKLLSYDTIVWGRSECGKDTLERPDFHFMGDNGHVMLEVDEHQHKSYPCRMKCECPIGETECKCQQLRMLRISSNNFGGSPVIWIRYNPDTYKCVGGKPLANGSNKRMEVMTDWLRHFLEHPNEDGVSLVKQIFLYYDGYNVSKVKVEDVCVN